MKTEQANLAVHRIAAPPRQLAIRSSRRAAIGDLNVRPRMKLAINGALYGSIVDFGKAIEGPKIQSFESKYYGSGVELLYIELALQNEKGTNRDFSTYRSEHAWAQFNIVMGSGIDSRTPDIGIRKCPLFASGCFPNGVVQAQPGAWKDGFGLIEFLAECRDGSCCGVANFVPPG